MGGIVSRPSMPAAPAPEPAPAPKEAAPVKSTDAEAQMAAMTRARRRAGSRLLFNQDRQAGLGTQQSSLGGGAGEGQSTLS